jgi:hypothetical protein
MKGQHDMNDMPDLADQHAAIATPEAARPTIMAGREGSPLATLRSRINGVRRRRAAVRTAVGLSILGLALVAALACLFLVDWIFSLSRPGRLGLLVAAVGAVAWVYLRQVRPWLTVRESDLDLALVVERQEGIDSDLVAALEFENPSSGGFGSDDLRAAVVDYVAEFGKTWSIPTRVPEAALVRRLGWLAAAVAGLATAAVLRPDFATVFVNRMLLGAMHYPTKTRIESLAINGEPVALAPGGTTVVKKPLGQSLDFVVGVAGRIPESGRVQFVRIDDGTEASVELVADPARPAGGFAARLPKLTDSVRARVFAGDAWTDPIVVEVVALPIIDAAVSVTPPDYARDEGADEPLPAGARQVTVLEGSAVGVRVACANKKLRSAAVVVGGEDYPLVETPAPAVPAAGPSTWLLPAAGSPLAAVAKPTAVEIRVIDEDGLAPATPVTLAIRVKPDARPRVAAEMLTTTVLPTGSPRLSYRVADDHGIREIAVVLEPVTAAGEAAAKSITVAPLPPAGWIAGDQLPLAGSVRIPLAALGLTKGDQVRVILKATDYRGTATGQSSTSEPIVLDITDEAGILAALSETDERSAKQLETIIERQLGVGGTR